MQVHLVDGTYELFRHFFAVPPAQDAQGREIAAARGVLASMLSLLEEGATHVGVATDHVIESFRNDLYPGYKTGEGIDPALRSQFELLEECLAAAGFRVWAMVEHEADDALATAAEIAAADSRVERVLDLHARQGPGAVRARHAGRAARPPQAPHLRRGGCRGAIRRRPRVDPRLPGAGGRQRRRLPGPPGLRRAHAPPRCWRATRTSRRSPRIAAKWEVDVRGAARLAATLAASREDALLFRQLATLVRDVPGIGRVDDWRWRGPEREFEAICKRLAAPGLRERTHRLAERRQAAEPHAG